MTDDPKKDALPPAEGDVTRLQKENEELRAWKKAHEKAKPEPTSQKSVPASRERDVIDETFDD